MVDDRIRRAFEDVIGPWAAGHSPVFALAWQNVAFNPAGVARYLQAFMLPARMVSEDLTGKHRRYLGIYQVNVHLPKGQGTGEANATAAAFDVLFPASARITVAGLAVVIIEPPSPGPQLPSDTHFVFPISIPYRADTGVA